MQSQIETTSVEFDKIMADNASKMSQIHALEVKIRDFEIHLDATKSKPQVSIHNSPQLNPRNKIYSKGSTNSKSKMTPAIRILQHRKPSMNYKIASVK